MQQINSIFSGAKVDASVAEQRFKEQFEKAAQSDDPLGICVDFAEWFEEQFPTGKQSLLIPMLTKMINTFGYLEQYRNDRRMLKLWLKLSESKTDVSSAVLFERAYLAGCCRELAEFYVRWAELRECAGDASGARRALANGRANHAVPLGLLNDAADALEMRLLRASLSSAAAAAEDGDNAAEGDDLARARIALGGLTGLGNNENTPAIRYASAVAKGLQNRGRNTVPQSAKKTSNNFLIYEGEDDFDSANPLVPKDFGDTLAHVELAENSSDPSKWKEARIDGMRQTRSRGTASFNVFVEGRRLPATKLQSERLRKRSLVLMIADREKSVEESYSEHLERTAKRC